MSDPLEVIDKLDSEALRKFREIEKIAFSEGKIPLKYKYLTAMALDALNGAAEGVRVLARASIENGATKEEIAETLRIVIYIGGAGALYTAANGLKDLIE
jgi:alkylhydroperoxidase/carboxymuconolactone decarboxylase family protein YurZ